MKKLLTLFFLSFFCGITLFSTPAHANAESDRTYLMAVILGEAGGEGPAGMQAVASTVVNRRNFYQASKGNTRNITISDICLSTYGKKSIYQYNALTSVGPNLSNIKAYIQKKTGGKKTSLYQKAYEIADLAVKGQLQDNTGGAMLYYATTMKNPPSWSRNAESYTIGHHRFIYGKGMSSLFVNGTKIASSASCHKNKNGKTVCSNVGAKRGQGASGGSYDPGSEEYGGGSGGSVSGGGDIAAGYDKYTYVEPDVCGHALTTAGTKISTEIGATNGSAEQIMDNEILIGMKEMMVKIYQSLSLLSFLGDGLMCYAEKAAYVCLIGADGVGCALSIPQLGMYITGVLIYITGFLMSMSIGMYFLDISFKVGFAVLFLPVSIGLWPFAPTQSKFMENISIILHNAMLFAFASIGVSYAVILIEEGVFDGGAVEKLIDNIGKVSEIADQRGFNWSTMFSGKDADVKASLEYMTENYSIESTNVLIILFCLFFGFKILASSINNYLNTFFSDGVFGNTSPMHHMGTQALGFIKANTVDPAVGLAKDIALTQSGRAIAGAAGAMGRVGERVTKGDFSDIKNAANGVKNVGHAVFHPKETAQKAAQKAAAAVGDKAQQMRDAYNNKMQAAGAKLNKGIQSTADKLVKAADTVQKFTPGVSADGRIQRTLKMKAKVDSAKVTIGNAAEAVVAHGGGAARQAAVAGGKIAAAALQNKGKEIGAAVQNSKAYQKAAEVGAEVKGMARSAAETVQNSKAYQKAAELGAGAKELAKDTGQFVKATAPVVGAAVKSGAQAVERWTRPTEKTLTPGNLLKKITGTKSAENSSTGVSGDDKMQDSKSAGSKDSIKDSGKNFDGTTSQKFYNTVKKLKDFKKSDEKGKIIIKSGGRIVLRTAQEVARSARGTAQETAGAGLKVTGAFLKGLGESLQHHEKGSGGSNWRNKLEQDRLKEEAAEDQRLREKTLIDD